MIHWGNPRAVHLVWFVLALVCFWFFSRKARLRALAQYADARILPQIVSAGLEQRRLIKTGLFFAALICAVIALCRPQAGFQWEETRQRGIDILIALDTSKSMLATDVKPSRLERSKFAIQDLIHKLRGDRVGLIAFAGSSFTECPLTADYAGFLMTLKEISTASIPLGGTNISAAIDEAIAAYRGRQGGDKALILITDGENLDGDIDAACKRAHNAGITIHCIGIGTPEGELIQIESGQGKEFLKDARGVMVRSRLDEKTLSSIARSTGGMYIRSQAVDFGFDAIYNQRLAGLHKTESDAKMIKRYSERFQVPLGFLFVFLIIEMCVPERRRVYARI